MKNKQRVNIIHKKNDMSRVNTRAKPALDISIFLWEKADKRKQSFLCRNTTSNKD